MSSTVQNIRAKIKRRLSRHEKNPNIDEYDDADEETQSYLNKQIEESEKHNYDQGKPGSLLNRLIAHGNKKTEDEMRRASEANAAQRSSAA